MPSNTVQIQILPETDTIHLYRDESTTLNEGYDFRGHIRLIPIIYKKEKKKKHVVSSKPIQVHHIHLRLQGYVQTMLTSDFSDSDKGGGDRWCKDTTTLPLLDRILYSARGYANVTECVLDQHLTITPGILSLTKVTDLPFHFPIENTQHLPPTIASPRHLICYYLSATLHPQESPSHARLSSSFPASTSSLPILSSPSPLPEEEEQQRKKRRFDLRHRPFLKSLMSKLSPNPSTSTPSLSTLSSSPSFSSFHGTSPTICARLPITVQCHLLGSLYALQHQPRIRYCGARPSSLRYQVHLAKYVRLQPMNTPTELSFQCSFFPLSPSIHIQKLVCYLIQYETYPLRSGQISSVEPLAEHQLETKSRKVGFKEQVVESGDSLDRLSISVSLNNPQLVPPLNTTSLQVTHKLRLAVYFQGKEKKMTLSFPIVFCHLPPTTPSMSPTHVPFASLAPLMRMYTNTSHYMNDISLQDSTTDDHGDDNHTDANEPRNGCKLPSYLDVMSEGPPPSPFLEDQLVA